MTRDDRRNVGVVFLLSGLIAAGGWTSPAAAQPAEEEAREEIQAVVLEVAGSVRQAPVGTDAKDEAGWTEVKVDDRLSAGTQIKTGFRSYANLKIGEGEDVSVVQVRKMTLASIDDLYRSETEQSVRLGLGYGVIRGGSIEGRLRSDVVVDSTVATLAKRGTEGWQMEVEPSAAHFKIALSRSGLVEALSKLTGRRKEVRPGEYANQKNIMMLWINQALFDRAFKFYADESKSDTEVSFASANTTGNAVLSPSSGTESSANSFQNNPTTFQQLTGGMMAPGGVTPPLPTFVNRPEGDFGIPDTFGALFSDVLPLKGADDARRAVRTGDRRLEVGRIQPARSGH